MEETQYYTLLINLFAEQESIQVLNHNVPLINVQILNAQDVWLDISCLKEAHDLK